MAKAKLTKKQIESAKDKVIKARQLLNQAEDILGEGYTEEEMGALQGDDPLSNVAAAIVCLEDALNGLGKGSPFIAKSEVVEAAEQREIIHLSDWNSNDRAYTFPTKLMKELHDRMVKDGGTAWVKQEGAAAEKMKEHWDWFFKHAKQTKGVEDADVFLDYSAPKESAEEWEEYYEGSEGWD